MPRLELTQNPLDATEIAFRRFLPDDQAASQRVPAVLVHGTALSQAIWRGFGWVAALAAQRPVITLDLRGHGRSGHPHDPAAYSMDHFAADVLAVLDAVAAPAVHLVGYSLGGRIGFSLAHTHAHRLRTLTSVAGSFTNSPGAFDRVFFPGVIDALESGDIEVFLTRWAEHSGRPVDAATAQAMRANDPLALAAYMREADADRGVPRAALEQLDLPILMLAGTRDAERERAAQIAVPLLPNARFAPIPGASHAGVLQRPEAVAQTVAFLADHD